MDESHCSNWLQIPFQVLFQVIAPIEKEVT